MDRHDTWPVWYPVALALTLAVEVPVYLVAFRVAGLLPGWRGVGAAAGVNLVTHPVVWAVLVRAGSSYWLAFGVLEAAAWVVESLLLIALVRRDALLLALTALVANIASVLAGFVMQGHLVHA
jgi:hypothetical protein